MNFKRVLLLSLLFLSLFISAEAQTVRKMLPDLMLPRYMDLDENNIYITNNRVKFYCYSLKNNGTEIELNISKGNGPGEYHCPPMVRVLKDKIAIITTKKNGYYNRKGKYLREEKKKFASFKYRLNDGYIKPISYKRKNGTPVWGYELYSSKGKKIKRLFTTPVEDRSKYYKFIDKKMTRYLIPPCEMPCRYVSGNSFYLLYTDLKDNRVKLFSYDNSKKTARTMTDLEFERMPVREEDKEKIYEEHMIDFIARNSERYSKTYKKQTIFKYPEFYPRYGRFYVDNGKIYIFTGVFKGGTRKLRIFDMNGKLLGEQFVKKGKVNLYTIRYGNYYCLEYDEDDEEWYLNITKLK